MVIYTQQLKTLKQKPLCTVVLDTYSQKKINSITQLSANKKLTISTLSKLVIYVYVRREGKGGEGQGWDCPEMLIKTLCYFPLHACLKKFPRLKI